MLRRVSPCFKRRGDKQRFIATCLEDEEEKDILRRHVGDFTDWKWEYMGQFLHGARDELLVLQRRFDVDKYPSGHVGGVGEEKDSKVGNLFVTELAEMLAVPNLAAKAKVLRVICFAADRSATRLEGCRCRERLLRGGMAMGGPSASFSDT